MGKEAAWYNGAALVLAFSLAAKVDWNYVICMLTGTT